MQFTIIIENIREHSRPCIVFEGSAHPVAHGAAFSSTAEFYTKFLGLLCYMYV